MSSNSYNYPSSSTSSPPSGNTGSGSPFPDGPWPSYSSGSSSSGTNSSNPSSSSPSSGSSSSSSPGSSSSSSGSSGSSSGNSSGSGGSSSSSSSDIYREVENYLYLIIPSVTGAVKAKRHEAFSVYFKSIIQIVGCRMKEGIYGYQHQPPRLVHEFSVFNEGDVFFTNSQPLNRFVGPTVFVPGKGFFRHLLLAYSLSGTAIEGVDYIVNSPYYDHKKRVGIIYDRIPQLTDGLVILPRTDTYIPERTIEFCFSFLSLDADLMFDLHDWDFTIDINMLTKIQNMSYHGQPLSEDACIETPDVYTRPGIAPYFEDHIANLECLLSGKGTTLTILNPDPEPSTNPPLPSNTPPQITSTPPSTHTIALHGSNHS